MSLCSPLLPFKPRNSEKKKNGSKVVDASIRNDYNGNHPSSRPVLERGTGSNFYRRGEVMIACLLILVKYTLNKRRMELKNIQHYIDGTFEIFSRCIHCLPTELSLRRVTQC